MIQELLPQAERIAALLKANNETIAIAESSTAGLVSAALLAIPGASAYFLGGAVVYTRQSRAALLGVTEQELAGIRPSTEPYALLFARKIRGQLATTRSPSPSRLKSDFQLGCGSVSTRAASTWLAVVGLAEVVRRKPMFLNP